MFLNSIVSLTLLEARTITPVLHLHKNHLSPIQYLLLRSGCQGMVLPCFFRGTALASIVLKVIIARIYKQCDVINRELDQDAWAGGILSVLCWIPPDFSGVRLLLWFFHSWSLMLGWYYCLCGLSSFALRKDMFPFISWSWYTELRMKKLQLSFA